MLTCAALFLAVAEALEGALGPALGAHACWGQDPGRLGGRRRWPGVREQGGPQVLGGRPHLLVQTAPMERIRRPCKTCGFLDEGGVTLEDEQEGRGAVSTQVEHDLQHLELHSARPAVQTVQKVLQEALAAAQGLVGNFWEVLRLGKGRADPRPH